MSPLSAAVLVLTSLYLTIITDACLETARSDGFLSQEVTIKAVTLTSKNSASCQCCALCYQDKACASLSFNADTRECQLYSSVASYETLTPDSNWQYLVMPGRSRHQQFCRQDSDCQAKGDFCRGRVCTDLTTVTCRVIAEQFGAGDRFDKFLAMHGWVSGRPVRLRCRMNNGIGLTRLFKNMKGTMLSRDNVTNFNPDAADGESHSILYLAEEIRLSRLESTYKVYIRLGSDGSYWFEVPREQPVLTDTSRREPLGECSVESSMCNFAAISLPYRVPQGDNLIVVNVILSEENTKEDSLNGEGELRSLARTDGQLWQNHSDKIVVYIRE